MSAPSYKESDATITNISQSWRENSWHRPTNIWYQEITPLSPYI